MERKRFTIELIPETYEILEKMANKTMRSKVGLIRYLINKEEKTDKKKRGEHNEKQ
jgi:predicted DNA-binding protein